MFPYKILNFQLHARSSLIRFDKGSETSKSINPIVPNKAHVGHNLQPLITKYDLINVTFTSKYSK